MAERVEVLGLDKVLKNLKGLEPELKRKALLSGAKAGAGLFKRAIVAKVPVKTGALKRAVGVRQMKKSLKDIVGAMVVIRTAGARTKKQKIKGEDAWYWFFQEYGWNAGGKFKVKGNRGLSRSGFRAKNKKSGTKVKGKFFVKKSFDSNKDKIKKAYMTKIKTMVDKYRGI